jgi:uncharacterized protein (TIGR01319 family)
MDQVLTVDFGSTYTKAALFDLRQKELIGSGYAPSTVDTDITVGLRAALREISSITDIGDVTSLVSSSAAGGLRVATIGLVPSLSLEAAQRAALGAGAKIVSSVGFKVTAKDIDTIRNSRPDIILLAGGIDGGDEETILHNAEALSKSPLEVPIIVAGNKVVASDCIQLLAEEGKTVTLADNIFPEIDRLEVGPVHEVIRELFMNRITHAKRIDHVSGTLNLAKPIIPTPKGVLDAAQLLSEGTDDEPGMGTLVIVDIGGATTDVHSAAHGSPTKSGVIQRGLPEFFLKRTVEGDLGMRVNAETLLERVGTPNIARLAGIASGKDGPPAEREITDYIQDISRRPERVPRNMRETTIEAALGRAAVHLAVSRHAGTLREVFTTSGAVWVQEGKDLSVVCTVIGVGGVLTQGRHPRYVLEGALENSESPFSLMPQQPALYIDAAYVLFGIGLLAGLFPTEALRLAKKYLLSV